ncbi:MAG: sulfite exporter TauE/SafE family protein [Bacteroidota bacterium]|nr:sulfite exporter TauE/SafE family protein [Bacteroidota bacterium]
MEYLFLISLFVIAFLYSSVGHGGGTGYLALLALFGIAPVFMKSTALTLNVFVSAISFFSYYKAGYFRWKLVFPFLITSIPFAYLGAMTKVNPSTYKIILGIFLLIAVARMLFVPKAITETSEKVPILLALAIGALLGLFSGMIGIGGGIILSPIIILMHWANVKESAAASALFIFLNSISGLFGLATSGFTLEPHIVVWIIVGIVGGISGSYMGSFSLKSDKLKFVLAAVLLMASIKLFIF